MFGVGTSWQHSNEMFSCTKRGNILGQLSWETAQKIAGSGSWHIRYADRTELRNASEGCET